MISTVTLRAGSLCELAMLTANNFHILEKHYPIGIANENYIISLIITNCFSWIATKDCIKSTIFRKLCTCKGKFKNLRTSKFVA